MRRAALDPAPGEVDELDFSEAPKYICPDDGVALVRRQEGGYGFRCPVCRRSWTDLIGRPVRRGA